MKKLSRGLQKALNRKTKGTDKKTETRVTVGVMRSKGMNPHGNYFLTLSTGLRLLHTMQIPEYEAKEIASKLGIGIEGVGVNEGTG